MQRGCSITRLLSPTASLQPPGQGHLHPRAGAPIWVLPMPWSHGLQLLCNSPLSFLSFTDPSFPLVTMVSAFFFFLNHKLPSASVQASICLPQSETKINTHSILIFQSLSPQLFICCRMEFSRPGQAAKKASFPCCSSVSAQCWWLAVGGDGSPSALQAASLGPKPFHGRWTCVSSSSSVPPGVNSWGEHFPGQRYGFTLIFPQHAQQSPDLCRWREALTGTSWHTLMWWKGTENWKDSSGTKVPWTELPAPRDLFVCITGWNFQFLIRITRALTRKFANLLLYISIHVYCVSYLGKSKTTKHLLAINQLHLNFISIHIQWKCFGIYFNSVTELFCSFPALPVVLQLLLWPNTFATCAQECLG